MCNPTTCACPCKSFAPSCACFQCAKLGGSLSQHMQELKDIGQDDKVDSDEEGNPQQSSANLDRAAGSLDTM